MVATRPDRPDFIDARSRLVALLVPLVVLLVLAGAAPALALIVTGPKVTFGTLDCSVKVASSDPTGTVLLLRDGQPWAHLASSPGSTLLFRKVALKGVGNHVITASITTGTASVTSPGLKVRVYAWPRPPVLVGVDSTRLTARRARIRVAVATDVIYAELFLNGRFVRRFKVTPNRVNDLGTFAMPLTRNTVGLRLGNPAGYRPVPATWKLARFTYPVGWPTCIVVVKSQLRLYWIRNDVLVKSYPVATGRPSLPTPSGYWRIDMKYRTSPSSVFGPRKMRLFRLRSGRFVYTNYNLHGTNVEASIGTYASHGCIRMHNRDVLELFPQVPLHTLVQTR